MFKSHGLAFAIAALSLGGCHSHHPPAQTVNPSSVRPRLVVSIVLDQVGTWVLDRHLGILRDDGALKPLIAHGTWVHDVVYPYAGTYTGPGHAAIYTGAPPAESGVVANRRWDRERARMVGMIDDGVHAQFDPEGRTFVSPTAVRAETVSDALRTATEARGRHSAIVSISMKDRGAVIPGGQHPDMAVWYTEEARGFTTSRYYRPEMPEWVTRFNTAHPLTGYFSTPWTVLDPAAIARLGARDDQPGEGNWKGLGAVFPHDLSQSRDALSAFLATPMSTDHLLDAARAAVAEYHMGDDDTPDLLMLSISGTDYVGHVFGPESVEAADNLLRIDLALGRFLRELSARTDVAVLVTADHGVMPLIERAHDEGHADAARVQFDDVVSAAERACDAALGPGDWVAAYVQPFVYLTPHALEAGNRERAITAAREGISHVPGVGAVHPCAEAVQWRTDANPLRRAVALSIDPAVAGELFVVPAEYSVVDERMPQGAGTSHGSPFARDTHVPVIFGGAGVEHRDVQGDQSFERVAATLSALLGVPSPAHARVEPLPGLLQAPRPSSP